MLHYVHQLVANCVCLLFGAGQVACSKVYSFSTENGDADESCETEPK